MSKNNALSLEVYDSIASILFNKFNIPVDIVNKLSILDIIKLSATGYSNDRIALRLETSTKHVEDILTNFLCFTGWTVDLDFSPVAILNKVKSFDEYKYEVELISPATKNSTAIIMSYNVAYQYNRLKEEVERGYKE